MVPASPSAYSAICGTKREAKKKSLAIYAAK